MTTARPTNGSAENAKTRPFGIRCFSLPNLSSQQVTIVDPTQLRPAADLPLDKKEYNEWKAVPSTQHAFLSCCEGLNHHVRVTRENPPFRLHGVIFEYDCDITEDAVAKIPTKNGVAGMLPMWVVRSRFRNGRRLVWEFESPVMADNEDLANRFLQIFAKDTKAKHLLAGFDETTLKVTQYQELGIDWQPIPGATPVSSHLLGLTFYKAASQTPLKGDEPQIPIEKVAEEVERRWPGIISGEFKVGLRTPLFWLDDGIDRIGAQVGDFGMICYSDRAGKSFLSWGDLLGSKFVREFEASRIGAAMVDTYFVEEKYWKQTAGVWRPNSKENFADDLRVRGISSRPSSRSDPASDVARVMSRLRAERVLDAAVPIVHDSREIIDLNGRKVLNISRIKAMRPADADDPQQSAWLHEFFEKVWDPAEMPQQKDHFLAWFQRYYQNALEGHPKAGQAVVIAGDIGIGKTFLSWRIVGKALGGFSDGARFLKGETSFNKEIAEVPLLAIDDSEIADEVAARNKFTCAVKKFVADPQITYHPKGINEISIPCKNRIIITCNTDAHSLGVLPRLDNSIKDKLMFFKFGKWKPCYTFPGGIEPEKYVANILPLWLRWLLDWEAPSYALSENPRFGVNPYKHPDLVHAVEEESPKTTLKQLIGHLWASRKEPEWMSAREIYASLYVFEQNRSILARELGGVRLGRNLELLAKEDRTYVLEVRRDPRTNANTYLITSPTICAK